MEDRGIMAPIRVLQVVPAMEAGGLETFIMNVYRNLDRDKVQFDFLYHYARRCFFDDEIESLGGQIHRLPVREDNRFFRYFSQLDELFSSHPEYRILHGHYTGFAVFYNNAAKNNGVPVRIVHSHNTRTEKSLTGLFDATLSSFCTKDATHLFACGQLAGNALFGKRAFSVYPNGINLSRFAYQPVSANETRQRFGFAPDAIVYGHIGRFTQQKNHRLLVNIFAEIVKKQPNARLLLAGEGPLEDETRKQVTELGLNASVVFAGLQRDTPALYSAMDCFLLPSLFEGLPVVLVEAQASGLPCFVSNTVSAEAKLTDNLHFIPLEDTPAEWAAALTALPLARQNNQPALRAAGYDIADTAQSLTDFYLEHQ